MKFHTIIFDVGGTLIGAPDFFSSLEKKLSKKISDQIKSHFYKVYTGKIFYTVKNILKISFDRAFLDLKISPPSFDIEKFYHSFYLNESFLFDETLDTLGYLLRQKVKLVIVSDADSDTLVPELKKFNLIHYFEKILVSSDLQCYKSSPQMASKIGPYLDQPFSEILFVGDTKEDIQTAKALNVKSLFINRNAYTPEISSDFYSLSLKELINIIK